MRVSSASRPRLSFSQRRTASAVSSASAKRMIILTPFDSKTNQNVMGSDPWVNWICPEKLKLVFLEPIIFLFFVFKSLIVSPVNFRTQVKVRPDTLRLLSGTRPLPFSQSIAFWLVVSSTCLFCFRWYVVDLFSVLCFWFFLFF